ncbi:MAG: hypothetical protein M1814_005833, partial [Vezdaea aestivalis]
KFSVSVDTSAYVKWKLDKDKGRETNTADLPIVHASAAVAASPVSSGINPATPYPASFTHIVELIMSGKPVPGVKDIPVTVLEGERSANVIPKRRKPWETG